MEKIIKTKKELDNFLKYLNAPVASKDILINKKIKWGKQKIILKYETLFYKWTWTIV